MVTVGDDLVEPQSVSPLILLDKTLQRVVHKIPVSINVIRLRLWHIFEEFLGNGIQHILRDRVIGKGHKGLAAARRRKRLKLVAIYEIVLLVDGAAVAVGQGDASREGALELAYHTRWSPASIHCRKIAEVAVAHRIRGQQCILLQGVPPPAGLKGREKKGAVTSVINLGYHNRAAHVERRLIIAKGIGRTVLGGKRKRGGISRGIAVIPNCAPV